MDLNDLKKEIPYKWRVQSTNQYGSNCVAYIDARQAQDLLDEVVGPENWQVKYEEHKNNMFCSIGINVNSEKPEWVWKSDCGTESQVEKKKGEASDAFKRAGVMWGIGRFLYSLKVVKIKEVAKDKNSKYYPTHNGKKILDITKHCNGMMTKTAPVKLKQGWLVKLDNHGQKSSQFSNVEKAIKDGRITTIKQVADVYQLNADVKSELIELLTK